MARELDLYEITEEPSNLRENLIRLRNDYDNHIHDGTSSRTFQTLIAETVSARVLAIRKSSYTDNTVGLWAGLINNQPKFFLGSGTDYFKFDQNGFAIAMASGTFDITQSIGTLRISSGGITFRVASTDNAGIRLYSGSDPISAGVCMTLSTGGIAGNAAELELIWSSNNTGILRPASGDTIDLGDSSQYFNEINYKTLTDRGCLGWFDGGVVLQDGRKVKDTEAIKSIQKHPSKLTVYGVEMLDYSTMPKAVYKPAPIAKENIYEKDKKGEPTSKVKFYKGEKIGEDGAETTALISIMLGAIKELTERVEELEGRIGVIPKNP